MSKLAQRQKIRYRIRKKVQGTATKPRLSVFRSNAEGTRQISSVTSGEGVTFTGQPVDVDTKEEETTV